VVGAADRLKGQTPIGLLVLIANGTCSEEEVIAGVIQRVRDQIGPVAAFKQARSPVRALRAVLT